MTRTRPIPDLTELGLSVGDAESLGAAIESMRDLPPVGQWRRLTAEFLTPDHPFPVHRFLFDWVYAGWCEEDGPPPAWIPDPRQADSSNIGQMMGDLGYRSYRDFHGWTIGEREAFWEAMIERLNIRFKERHHEIRESASPLVAPGWLPGARLNIAESCFQSSRDAPAVIFQNPGEPIARISFGELESLSARVANGLVEAGFVPGDAIAVIMPMTMESVAIYLGIVRAGCVVVSISDSFAAEEIAMRLEITASKGVFTQDFLVRSGKRIGLYQRIVDAGAPRAVVLSADPEAEASLQRDTDRIWEAFLSDDSNFASFIAEPGAATNLLFSSGTTGEPKVIPWSHTTPIKCAADAWLHHDVRPGDVLAWPTNLGWMMGPWLIYAALINRATIALYPDVPTGRGFGAFVRDAGVTMLGLVPSLVRSWRESGCMEGLDWSRIRVFSSTGECSNTEDMLYLMMLAGYKPIIEYCGGTEIGGGYLTGTVVQAASPATFSTPALGLDFDLVDEAGNPARSGELLLIPPSIGLSNELLNADHYGVYHADVPPRQDGTPRRRHGDEIEAIGGGYYRHHGRADDTMNLGGIKVSSVEIERILNQVSGVHETAAIAVSPKRGGPDRLVICLVCEAGNDDSVDAWRSRFRKVVRERLNPLFKVADIVMVESLPRTASNKVMRRKLRAACQEAQNEREEK
ncbi:MAG: AMP-dependent synthetase [Verrucomicrobia bacterium]|nr:MAG: AMP-dependent synthetase [Verrucomicrobiota bacterium]